jgi:hypothetical protein
MKAEEKTSKLHDIKETASDAVEIMRQIGTPGVQESIEKVKEIVTIAKEVMEALKTPEMIKNIENLRLISDNMKESSTNMQNTVKQLKETGVIDETKGALKSAKSMMDSFSSEGSINGQDLHQISTAIKETIISMKGVMDEIKLIIASSKKSD